MIGTRYNLLNEQLIGTFPNGPLSLPGVLAALARDEVDNFPALRPHQAPAWHMFLVQLMALALHRSGQTDIPEDEADCAAVLRGLTPEFPEDEPWCLLVEDNARPAFMQPPVPSGMTLVSPVPTPDALDMLITAKNHDLKQSVARTAAPEDWSFALVSLQTGEGFGGQGNYGIARMNGGSSSRVLLSLAPQDQVTDRAAMPRFGAWLCRNVARLIETRSEQLRANDHLGYPTSGGLALTWMSPWPERRQLRLPDLDIWFIEVCRRIRLRSEGGALAAMRGKSGAERIEAKALRGNLGDPFAPVHKAEGKSLTLGEGKFDYRRLVDLLFSGDWSLPVTAGPAAFEPSGHTLALVAQAIGRGNSKTFGFNSRVIPLGGKVPHALGPRRRELHELAKAQVDVIAKLDGAMGYALALAAAAGDRTRLKKAHYAASRDARDRFDRAADAIFFEHLWRRLAARDAGAVELEEEGRRFAETLHRLASNIFEAALPGIRCASALRPRAEARARRAFDDTVRHHFPELFDRREQEDTDHAA